MIRRRAVLAATGAFWLIAAADPTVLELPVDTPTQSQGEERGDVYLFAGIAGSRQTILVKGSGSLEVSLLTPRGDLMKSVKGDRAVSLEAVLSSTGVHSAVVLRDDGAKPYTIARAVVEPTFAELMLSYAVGYSGPAGATPYKDCWIEPGRKRKVTYFAKDMVITRTDELSPDRSTVRRTRQSVHHNLITKWGKPFTTLQEESFSYRVEGQDLVTTTYSQGYNWPMKQPLIPIYALVNPEMTWSSYLCD